MAKRKPKIINAEKLIEWLELQRRAVKMYKNYYHYSPFVFSDIHVKSTIICPAHGPFNISMHDHLNNRGGGCPHLGCKSVVPQEIKRKKLVRIRAKRKLRKVEKECVEKAVAFYGNDFDYSKCNFRNIRDKSPIICKSHGEFKQSMYSHLKLRVDGGSPCPICRRSDRAERVKTIPPEERRIIFIRELIARAVKIHNGFYDYSQFVYKGYHVKSTIICPEHGAFQQTMAVHLRKRNRCCGGCSGPRGYDKNKPGLLYYFSVNTPTGLVYKIGITNRSFEERYPKRYRLKTHLIYEIKFADGEECSEVEQQIIKENQDFKYTGPPPLKCVGIKEMFTKRIYLSMRDR